MFITAADKQSATLGVLQGLSSGDIVAFCSPAKAILNGNILELSCDKQEESGAYTTRGNAKINLENGLSAVSVLGEVKRITGWKVDTNILCENLEAQVN